MTKRSLNNVFVRIWSAWERHSRKDGRFVTKLSDPSPVTRRNSAFSTVALVSAANLIHGMEVVDELGLGKAKPVSSPAAEDSVTRCKDDESKSLDEEGKRLYQRIIATLNYLAHDRKALKYATSCVASAVSSPSIGVMRAAKRVGRYLRKAPVARQGFTF